MIYNKNLFRYDLMTVPIILVGLFYITKVIIIYLLIRFGVPFMMLLTKRYIEMSKSFSRCRNLSNQLQAGLLKRAALVESMGGAMHAYFDITNSNESIEHSEAPEVVLAKDIQHKLRICDEEIELNQIALKTECNLYDQYSNSKLNVFVQRVFQLPFR